MSPGCARMGPEASFVLPIAFCPFNGYSWRCACKQPFFWRAKATEARSGPKNDVPTARAQLEPPTAARTRGQSTAQTLTATERVLLYYAIQSICLIFPATPCRHLASKDSELGRSKQIHETTPWETVKHPTNSSEVHPSTTCFGRGFRTWRALDGPSAALSPYRPI